MAVAPPAPAPVSVTLDADQTKAAQHRVGTAAVAAAAGSGKTTLLVGRAIALVESGERPESVLTLAFNRNAAATLRERLSAHPATRGSAAAMASTFHAFGLQTLRIVMPKKQVLPTSAAEEAARVRNDGGVPKPTARDVAKAVWTEMGGDLYGEARPSFLRGVSLDELINVEPGARERLFTAGWPAIAAKPVELSKAVNALQLKDVSGETLEALKVFMPKFRAARQKLDVVDFTDMLLGLGHFIRTNNEAVMTFLRGIRHLQIDEAQDGNELRWYIGQTIASFGEGRSVMAVGDLRQSIAGFAGAQPAMFRKWWDGADAQFALPRNYRSAALIVAAGNAVAHGEPWNVGGDAIAARADLGEGSLRVESVGTLRIAMEVASALKNGEYTHKDVTVLARTRAALETVAFGLRTQGVKCVVRGGGFAWRSMDGRMIRAYLDLAEGNVRDAKAFGMAINRPLRYISGAKLREWITPGGTFNDTVLWRASEKYKPAAALVEARAALQELSWEERVDQVRDWLIEGMEADRAEVGSAPGATSDKADLIRNLCDIARVAGSVANLDLAIDAEQQIDPKAADVVELSTIHQSKGDQWLTVYVTGVAEGVFPHIRATSDEELAEEVRLLYVAVTRPVSSLIVDVSSNVGRFESKIAALEAVVPATPQTPPPAPPAPPRTQLVAPESASQPQTAVDLAHALELDHERAEALTAAGVQPKQGERFVPVAWRELTELLAPHGFRESHQRERRADQRVLAVKLADGAELVVYTSVPRDAEVARGNGDDSIKVVLFDTTNDRPLTKKQPFAARTRNWRVTLLSRLATALESHPSFA